METNAAEQVKERRIKRLQFLVRLYKVSRRDMERPCNALQLGHTIGISEEETQRVVAYLKANNDIALLSEGGPVFVSLTKYGRNSVEEAIMRPEDAHWGTGVSVRAAGVMTETEIDKYQKEIRAYKHQKFWFLYWCYTLASGNPEVNLCPDEIAVLVGCNTEKANMMAQELVVEGLLNIQKPEFGLDTEGAEWPSARGARSGIYVKLSTYGIRMIEDALIEPDRALRQYPSAREAGIVEPDPTRESV